MAPGQRNILLLLQEVYNAITLHNYPFHPLQLLPGHIVYKTSVFETVADRDENFRIYG
jgi:hypothetical protein